MTGAERAHARRIVEQPTRETMQGSMTAAAICPPARVPHRLCWRGARAPARSRVSSCARIQSALESHATAVTTNAEDGDGGGGGGAARPLTAVIVGGGPGGLAACVALRRIGIDAHVYERATALDPNAGQGHHLPFPLSIKVGTSSSCYQIRGLFPSRLPPHRPGRPTPGSSTMPSPGFRRGTGWRGA
jgi:hypothetical protein